MRKNVVLAALFVCALLAPPAASAQQTEMHRVLTNRSMLGLFTEAVSSNGRPTLIIRDVVPGSPAEQAGLVRGDVITAIDGEPATRERLSASREPGQMVRLRVLRDGAESDVRVVTVARTDAQRYYVPALPDSVLGQMAYIMTNVRTHLDSVSALTSRFQVMGDSVRIITPLGDTVLLPFYDSTRVISGRNMHMLPFERDSIRVYRFGTDSVYVFRGDNDTLPVRFPAPVRAGRPEMRELQESMVYRRADIDSLRVHLDSARLHFADRLQLRRANIDSLFAYSARPSDIVTTTIFAGTTAVAGAALSELNPELAEYFGVSEGVLVLSAAEGTPAARAGIRPGDVIVQVNGTAVRSIAEIRRAVSPRAGGQTQIRVLRRGQPIDVTIGG